MPVIDLIPALHSVRSGQLSIDDLIAACASWAESPDRSLSEFLDPAVPMATAVQPPSTAGPSATVAGAPVPDATRDYVPNSPESRDCPPPTEAAGRYVPLQLHASGGMGRVWIARDAALGRSVAFKDLRTNRGGDSRTIGRFVREAVITGRLEHPGVVPVYAVGTKPDGGPFYAMRFIQGRSLTEVIRERHGQGVDFSSLPFRDLLGAFVSIGNAIAFAHSRGVLHRDLKPANIMVGEFGEVQVMDWGLAKEVGAAEAQATGDPTEVVPNPDGTQAGSVLGTPAYMAPEQAEGRTEDQDERTDVFGLGGILYEILTATAPFAGSNWQERSTGQSRPPVSARRVQPQVPASLDAICMKALAFRSAARYQSAKALVEDVRRWLGDEPVSAHRDPFRERARRWMRRHRTFVTAGSAVGVVGLLSLAIGLGAVTRVNQKLDTANSKLTESNSNLETANKNLSSANVNLDRARKTADDRRKDAEHARDQSDRVFTILVDALRKQDPTIDRPAVTLVGRLINTAQQVNKDTSLDPAMRVRLLTAIGQTFTGLGRPGDAHKAHKLAQDTAKGLPEKDHLVRSTANNYAIALLDAGQPVAALKILESLHIQARKDHGPDEPEALDAAGNYANTLVELGDPVRAVPLFEDILRRRKAKWPDDVRTFMTMSDLGNALDGSRRSKEAVTHLEEAHRRMKEKEGVDHPDTLIVAGNLGSAYSSVKRNKEAAELLEDTLERSKKRVGESHPRTINLMNNLAVFYSSTGKRNEALALYRAALAQRQKVLGLDHPDTLITQGNLGSFLLDSDDPREAVTLLRDAERRQTAALGAESSKALRAGLELAVALRVVGESKQAVELCESILERLKKHPEARGLAIDTDYQAGQSYRLAGQYEKARLHLTQHFEAMKKIHGAEGIPTQQTQILLAECLLKLGELGEAERLARETVAIRKKLIPGEWPYFAGTSVLGEVLLARKKLDEAEPLLTSSYAGLKEREKTIRPIDRYHLGDAAGRLAKLYDAKGDVMKRDEWRKVEEQERRGPKN
jgi:serine/threonine protein kinase